MRVLRKFGCRGVRRFVLGSLFFRLGGPGGEVPTEARSPVVRNLKEMGFVFRGALLLIFSTWALPFEETLNPKP